MYTTVVVVTITDKMIKRAGFMFSGKNKTAHGSQLKDLSKHQQAES